LLEKDKAKFVGRETESHARRAERGVAKSLANITSPSSNVRESPPPLNFIISTMKLLFSFVDT